MDYFLFHHLYSKKQRRKKSQLLLSSRNEGSNSVLLQGSEAFQRFSSLKNYVITGFEEETITHLLYLGLF